MPTFVHITCEVVAKKAKTGGLKPNRKSNRSTTGVFAMALTPNFQITHQWVREVKQWRRGTMVGVYFKIPDSEMVWIGRYNQEHRQVTAAEAASMVMAETTMTGIEVIIPRSIHPKEIIRVRILPQLVGWRHYPEAHGKRPWACECCQKGAYGSRKIRARLGGNSTQ